MKGNQMKLLIILATYVAFLCSPAFAGNSNFYGANGEYLGTMAPAGKNSSFIYGQDGSLVGSTARSGSDTFFYNADGGYAGQVTNSPQGNVNE